MVELARKTFKEVGLPVVEGYYSYYALPNYESKGDIQIMHDLGSATVGASTVPEHTAAFLTGMRRVIVSSATSPSSGMSMEQIDGNEVLLGG